MKLEKNDQSCLRCGACCYVDLAAYVTYEDIQRWVREGRQDIIDLIRENEVIWFGDRLINKSGREVNNCIFLSRDGCNFYCEIHDTLPFVCRNFIPGSSEICPQYYKKK